MRLLILIILLLPVLTLAQSTYIPLNEDYQHWIDRYEVKAGKVLPQVFTAVKPYKRDAVVSFIDSVDNLKLIQSRSDQFNAEYIRNDSWEWSQAETSVSDKPILKHFYKRKSDFYSFHNDDFDLHINPVIYWGAGKDSRLNETMFINTRGVEVRGMVDHKVGFYTYLTDNQTMLPAHVNDYVRTHGVIPHEGFWKRYKEGNGVDFLQARGYISFEATKHISLQFGHDRQFIGNGYRSLIFSDFAPPSLFFKGNVKVWKLNYLFLINQMTADSKVIGGGYPNKINSFHHISINIGKKFNLGVFESVIFSADDTTGANKFRLDYLNPIIFYRAIEQQNGSSDNVLLGMDFKWNAVSKLQFYGQFVLDEFLIENIRAQNGWWANKFAVQMGGKYVDAFGVPNLDLQGEVNIVRPFTYSHFTNYGSYSNYRQAIAHPLGANFKEIVGIMRYQPIPRLNVTGKLVIIDVGRDTTSAAGVTKSNMGVDILKNNQTRAKEFGNTLGQGVSNTIAYGTLVLSYQLKHNLFIDASMIIRKSKSADAFYNNDSNISSLALRWNIPQRLYEF